jgi:AcrR family transcriptional regulator
MSEKSTRLSKDKREESIIETSLNLLADVGFDALSMRAIAKAEGISESMLYRFFSNKHEILEVIIKNNAIGFIDSFKEIFEAIDAMIPDPEISLPVIGKLLNSKIAENKKFLRFITREGRKIPRIMRELRSEIDLEKQEQGIFRQKMLSLNFNESITSYFKRCKEAGNLRKELDPKDCALIFISNFLPLIILFISFFQAIDHITTFLFEYE